MQAKVPDFLKTEGAMIAGGVVVGLLALWYIKKKLGDLGTGLSRAVFTTPQDKADLNAPSGSPTSASGMALPDANLWGLYTSIYGHPFGLGTHAPVNPDTPGTALNASQATILAQSATPATDSTAAPDNSDTASWVAQQFGGQ